MSAGPEPFANPFPGLRPYQTGELLYGRGSEIREILEQIYAGRSVLLSGPPRCGKTSLVQAGLIPNLLERGYTVLPTVRLDWPIPVNFQDLDPPPNRFLLSLIQSLEAPMRVDAPLSPEALAEMDLPRLFAAYLPRFASYGPRELRPNASPDRPPQYVVILDQLERVFLPLEENFAAQTKGGSQPTFEPTAEQTALFEQLRLLHAQFRDQIRFILVLRQEFLDLAQTYFTPVSILTQWRVGLEALSPESAGQAITGPLNRLGMAVEGGAIQPLLDSLRRIRTPEGETISTSSRIDPFQLQIVLDALWERLPHDTQTLSPADIVQAGDVDEALAGYYRQQVQRAALQSLEDEGSLRDWIQKVLIGPDGNWASVAINQPGAPIIALELLEQAGILRLDIADLQVAYDLGNQRWVYPINLDNLRYGPAKKSAGTLESFEFESPSPPVGATQGSEFEPPLPDERVALSAQSAKPDVPAQSTGTSAGEIPPADAQPAGLPDEILVYAKDALKLHSQPGPFSPILAEITRGASLSLAPEADPPAALARLGNPAEWLHVRLWDGLEGYIEADLAQREPFQVDLEPAGATQPEAKPGEIFVYAVNNLKPHTQPGPFAPSLSEAARGTPLSLAPETDPQAALARVGNPAEWLHVRLPDGTEGYIIGDQAQREPLQVDLEPAGATQPEAKSGAASVGATQRRKAKQPSPDERVALSAQSTGMSVGEVTQPNAAWLVVARPEQYNWLEAYRQLALGGPGEVHWTLARGSLAQKHINAARPGDLVLAYSSASSRRAIVGLAEISSEPGLVDGYPAVFIRLRQPLEQPISLEELRRNLPSLEKVRQERASFSQVSPAEWHILRQVILHKNPSLAERLPETIGPQAVRRNKLDYQVDPVSKTVAASSRIAFDARVRHSSMEATPIPTAGNRLLAWGEWLPDQPPDQPSAYFSTGAFQPLESRLSADPVHFDSLELPVPDEPGRYLIRLTLIEEASLAEASLPTWVIDVTPAETDTLRLDILNLRREIRAWPQEAAPADWSAVDQLLGQAEGAYARNEREQALGKYMQAQALWLQARGEDLTRRAQGAASVGATQGTETEPPSPQERVAQPGVARPRRARSAKPDVPATVGATQGTETEPPSPQERVAQPGVARPRPAQSTGTSEESSSLTLSIVYSRPELAPPPPPADKLVIEIDDNAIELRFKDPESGQELAFRSSAQPLKRRLALYRPFDYSPREYGQLLFKALFNEQADQPAQYESTAAGYRKARAVAHQLALELVLHSQLNHAYLPWEYLSDESGSPLAALERSPFYRAWKKPVTPSELARWRIPARPLRILFVICDPLELKPPAGPPPEIEADLADNPVRLAIGELPALNAARLAGSLHQALHDLKQAGLVEYAILGEPGGQYGPASFENMSKQLASGRYHVLHLTAHGLLNPARDNAYALVMEDAQRHFELVSPERFDQRLVQKSGLRLAFLAACNSANIELFFKSQRDLAGRLLTLGLPAVIGMSDRIDEVAARVLAARFYDDLARLGRIEMALAAARSALYDDKPEQRDWGLPLLWMRPGLKELIDQDLEALEKLPRPSNAEIRAAAQAEHKRREPFAPLGKLAEQELRKAFQSYGLALPDLALNGLGERLAERINRPRPEGLPLAEPQPRAELLHLAEPLNLRAAELQEYVEQVTRLSLRPELYGHLAASLNAGKHLILIGPHGSAKTTLARAICEFASGQRLPGAAAAPPACHDYRLATATADWTTFDTIGGYMPDQDQTLQFRPGLFLEAIRSAHWLIVDEINRAEIDKAIGPLFTVLSGQGVDLPYRVQRQPVRILPPVERRPAGNPPPGWWIPAGVKDGDFSYVIHPNWRIIGTMNVYDKSSLFQLSFAFMRRFAFVEVELPGDGEYRALLGDWLQQEYPGLGLELSQAVQTQFERLLWQVTAPVEYQALFPGQLPTENPLMRHRAIGPAIARDMLAYIAQRLEDSAPPAALPPAPAGANPVPDPHLAQLPACFAEACGIYIVPQLDGLEHQAIKNIYTHIAGYILSGNPRQAAILKRIEQLYPHIHDWR